MREARSLHLFLIKLRVSVRQGVCVPSRPLRRDPASSSEHLQLLSHLRGPPQSPTYSAQRNLSAALLYSHSFTGQRKGNRRRPRRGRCHVLPSRAFQRAEGAADPAPCPGSVAAELHQTCTRGEERAGTKAPAPLPASCSVRARGAE